MKTLVLDGTAISIQVAMSTSAATTNPTFVATYADNAGSGITEGATDGALNGSTDVTVVPAPTGSNRRVIKDITIYNGDSAAVTVFVKYDNNATQRTLAKVTLQVGDTWTTDGTFDTNGNLKQSMGTVNLASQVTGTLPVANGGTGGTTASAARSNLSAAASGANSDITSLAGLTTALSVAQGGTGATTFTSGAILKGAGTSAVTTATAGTDYAGIDTAQTFTKGQRGEITALTDGATITPDFADSNNFSVTLGGNRTLANPSNLVAGQSGSIFITQDGTGSRTLAYGSYWDFAGGTAPVLSTAASSVDRLDYIVRTTTSIHAVLTKALS
jgi:hypothetical protein